ncbi:hypothetical protein ONE63_010901 [Megalurothrips usitatus]|uniref:LIM zinc-binding domain-containing protein n=1 Tax=Megalurothrips usitatus TaxID=439358 RepID=A0AAV7XEE5_9NEOP|nr:hypothetical protein ONE63_010901 [Megalurothrips usitatus]
MYRMNFYESTCLRCGQTVYQVDRVGPLKDFTFFHSGCFKCVVCGTKLTLKTYYNNQHRGDDQEVYCRSHVPTTGPGHLDGSSVVIRSALNVPRSSNFVNEQIRGSGKGTFDAEALNIRPHLNNNNNHSMGSGEMGGGGGGYQYGRFDASALHIAHALRATELQKSYNKAREKPIEYYLVSAEAGADRQESRGGGGHHTTIRNHCTLTAKTIFLKIVVQETSFNIRTYGQLGGLQGTAAAAAARAVMDSRPAIVRLLEARGCLLPLPSPPRPPLAPPGGDTQAGGKGGRGPAGRPVRPCDLHS